MLSYYYFNDTVKLVKYKNGYFEEICCSYDSSMSYYLLSSSYPYIPPRFGFHVGYNVWFLLKLIIGLAEVV